jgi:hypothetical protein
LFEQVTGIFSVIKVLIAGIYSFEGHKYNPIRISISALAYIFVPLLLVGVIPYSTQHSALSTLALQGKTIR